MNDLLLTISGKVPPDLAEQIARGERPTADYWAMGQGLPADLLDYDQAVEMTGRFGRLLAKLFGLNFVLAWACWTLRKKYRVIFTDGEQIGLPLAILLKFLRLNPFSRANIAKHAMIVHIISVSKKSKLVDLFRLHTHIDLFFVYSSWQKEYIEQRWHLPPDRVIFTHFMVDARFFTPHRADLSIRAKLPLNYPNRPILCAVGLEFRDYPTLIKAVENLPIQLIVAAGSPWSKRDDTTSGQAIPDNVLVKRFSQRELRDVYAISDFVTMPLYHVNFQAGVTAILEAMSMEKAIVCTSTPGQTDVIIHDETGYYIPPEDSESWRMAIQYLLDNPDEARRMGINGRNRVLQEMSLDIYVQRLASHIHHLIDPSFRATHPSLIIEERTIIATNGVPPTNGYHDLGRKSPHSI